MGTQRGPLDGVRALELAEIWAGPFCGSLLADMGAEVVKVEAIQRIARGAIKPRPGAHGYPDGEPGERPWNRSANFNALSRNKLGVTLDLTTRDGAETFKELVNVSDVVFTNYAFGVMDRFGLGYEELRRAKPDIIALFTPGYGNTGPYRTYRSMGMVIDAITGHTALRGYPDMPLSRNSLVHHPDAVAGSTAVFAICLALRERARTGKGQFIDLSQAETFMPHLGEVFLEESIVGSPRSRRGNRHPAMAPHGVYRCSGGDESDGTDNGRDRWVAISVKSDGQWRDMCAAMGTPELADDDRFATLLARLRNQDALDEAVARWTRGLDRYAVANALQSRGIAAGPTLDCGGDAYDDPHLQERGYFQPVFHPDAGVHLMSGPIWRSANRPEKRHDPAPGLGQHNNYVLGDLAGLSDERLAELEAGRIIGEIPLDGADMGGVRRAASRGLTSADGR